jgi:muconolactone delta-isomerase
LELRRRSGAIALSLIVSVESVQELDDLITGLPVWPRMETTVTPLSTSTSAYKRFAHGSNNSGSNK